MVLSEAGSFLLAWFCSQADPPQMGGQYNSLPRCSSRLSLHEFGSTSPQKFQQGSWNTPWQTNMQHVPTMGPLSAGEHDDFCRSLATGAFVGPSSIRHILKYILQLYWYEDEYNLGTLKRSFFLLILNKLKHFYKPHGTILGPRHYALHAHRTSQLCMTRLGP